MAEMFRLRMLLQNDAMFEGVTAVGLYSLTNRMGGDSPGKKLSFSYFHMHKFQIIGHFEVALVHPRHDI
jgi:hypothetical protein